jgi:hypothetical protein
MTCSASAFSAETRHSLGCLAFFSAWNASAAIPPIKIKIGPSVMGPMRSSPPSDRHAAELTLLSVVGAEAATLCCQRER